MKLRKNKRLALLYSLAITTLSAPLVTLACGGSSNPTGIDKATQDIINNEQTKINNLQGPKKITSQTSLSETTDATFDRSVANSFGIENFAPAGSFEYTYSHALVDKDGTFDLNVKVTLLDNPSTNMQPIKIEVEGIDLRAAQFVIQGRTYTSKLENDFRQVVVSTPSVLDPILLGYNLSSLQIDSSISILVSKAEGLIVRYTLTKGAQPAIEFNVTFNVFGRTEPISQVELNTEQIVINELLVRNDYQLDSGQERIAAQNTEAPFTSAMATKMGIVGFIPKSGFSYVYTHGAIENDGTLGVRVIAKAGLLSGSGVTLKSIIVKGIDFNVTQRILNNTISTTLTQTEFRSQVISANTSLDSVKNRMGLYLPSLPPSVTIKCAKASGSVNVTYTLEKTGQSPRTFIITFTEFAP